LPRTKELLAEIQNTPLMLIAVMEHSASVKDIGAVLRHIEERGLKPYLSRGDEQTQVGCLGAPQEEQLREELSHLDGVSSAFVSRSPFKLASREFRPESSSFKVGPATVGGKKITVIAGPCCVESADQLSQVGEMLKRVGVPMLRGGAFKPRTSPYDFQGMGEEGLKLLAQARARFGLRVVTECLKPSDVELVARYSDVIQIGARNMQNFALLQEVGKARIPVLLKRGMMSSLKEFLLSAEYILSQGNEQVALCERGIRTFETMTRNTLDIAAVPVLKRLTHLPVIIDPSHAAGDRELVPALSLAAVAAGADGLIIEVHPRPDEAVSDGPQSMTLDGFERLFETLKPVARSVGREL
jgi:3-deoxy-7-phosphoheptulonate synthase